MTQIAKLFEAVLANPRATLSFRDFVRLLEAFGFTQVRQSGSHRVFAHPQAPRPLIVQPRRNEAKLYQVGEFLDMVEQCQLVIE